VITRLDHIQMAMPQGGEERARSFFKGVLGMEEEPKPEPLAGRGGCWFRRGEVIVHVGVEKDFAPQGKAHPAFCVGDIDLTAGRLASGGHPVEWDETFPGRRRLYTADPFGNRIELIRDGDGFGQAGTEQHAPTVSPDGLHFVSTDKALIDLDVVCALLAASYWAKDRPLAVVEASLGTSTCFGLYEKASGRQVGFARIVTDGWTFSWLCDVAVDERERGKGLGKFLMACVMAHPVVVRTRVVLGTRDAHGLYEKYGFIRHELMRRQPPGSPQAKVPGTRTP
jgi:GNAT superfamily N-acetyltransferase